MARQTSTSEKRDLSSGLSLCHSKCNRSAYFLLNLGRVAWSEYGCDGQPACQVLSSAIRYMPLKSIGSGCRKWGRWRLVASRTEVTKEPDCLPGHRVRALTRPRAARKTTSAPCSILMPFFGSSHHLAVVGRECHIKNVLACGRRVALSWANLTLSRVASRR